MSSPKSHRLKTNVLGVILKSILSVFLIIIITGSICLMAAAVYITRYIDTDMDMTITSTELNYSTQLYASNSQGGQAVIYTLHGEQNREWVDYEDIPDYLKKAITAIEDERFWTHKGVDWKRTLGAGINLIFGFSSNYGGSTITQQLIKNITEDNEVTVQRKIQEILRAVKLEESMSKEDILELYLNTISLSQGCYGVKTAARVYFGKDVKDLTLAECASLAGITNRPAYYDPFVFPEHNLDRQKDILWKMYELGLITEEEYEDAKADELVFYRDNEEEESEDTSIPSYFVDLVTGTVISDLQTQLGYSKEVATRLLYSGGLQIYTTMDTKVQEVMESVYQNSDNFQRLSGITQPQSAMIVYSIDGDILGVVGGRGTKQGARVLNRAKSLRSVGSSIKPLSSYSPALEEGYITPFTVLDDYPSLYTDENGILVEKPETFEGTLKAYPKNYYKGFKGKMTARRAVELSTNTTAVALVHDLGLTKSFTYLESKFGISSLVNQTKDGDLNYGSLALGGFYNGVSLLELTSAYTTFTNDGVHNEPRCYTLITDGEGNVILDNTRRSTSVLSEKANYYMTYMLKSAVERGTSTAAKIDGIDVAGKTGTTNSDCDRLFIGYTPYYVGGVWYGYDYPKEIKGVDGNPALKLWKLVMDQLHEGKEDVSFETPDHLVSRSYCLDCGGIPTDLCGLDARDSRVATGLFYPGDEPTFTCTCHKKIVLCKDTGLLATPYCTDTIVISAVEMNREQLLTGTVADDNEYQALKVTLPLTYEGITDWAEMSNVNGKTSYTVYGNEKHTTFCTTHVTKPITDEENQTNENGTTGNIISNFFNTIFR